MIEITDLNKNFNTQPVLKDLSLTLAGGEFCILVGANGQERPPCCGFLPHWSGLTPEKSALKENRFLLTRNSVGNRLLGHQSLFYGDLSAWENLRHYARLYNLSNSEENTGSALNGPD